MLTVCEGVLKGHPDKVADQISDALMEALVGTDPERNRAAIEVLVTGRRIIVAGEATSTLMGESDESSETLRLGRKSTAGIINNAVCGAGYRNARFDDSVPNDIIWMVRSQSANIHSATQGIRSGDQGITYGHAAGNISTNFLPVAQYLTLKAIEVLEKLCDANGGKYGPDGKVQVAYDGRAIKSFVVSVRCDEGHEEELAVTIRDALQDDTTLAFHGAESAKLTVNPPNGKFYVGGPIGDCGLTGRKISVDSYCGLVPHGGGACCVDAETEYLTCAGWRKISDYAGEQIAQYHSNGTVSFVIPEYIKVPATSFYRLTMPHAIDQVLTPNHRFVYITTKGNLRIAPFQEVMDKHNASKCGLHASVIAAFSSPGSLGLGMSEWDLRLQIAFIADGSVLQDNRDKGRVRVKKPYKVERMRHLLQQSGRPYREYVFADNYTCFVFKPPRLDKHFTEFYWQANKRDMEIIADEMVQWDGNRKNVYRTTIKQSADFAQYVLTSVTGKRVSIVTSDRRGTSVVANGKEYVRNHIEYDVWIGKHSLCGLRHTHADRATGAKAQIVPYTEHDGYQYCFTVPTGMFVARRGDKIFITGNSGKDLSKVDRTGAYLARAAAKLLVSSGVCHSATVGLSWQMGADRPNDVLVTSDGDLRTAHAIVWDFVMEHPLAYWVKKFYSEMTIPWSELAQGCHFRNPQLPWEKL